MNWVPVRYCTGCWVHETHPVSNSISTIYYLYDFCWFISFSKFQFTHNLKCSNSCLWGLWKIIWDNECTALSTVIGHGYCSISITCDDEFDDGGAEDWWCVLRELCRLSSFPIYCGRLVLADKKRVTSSTSCLYPVQIVGVQIVFAVITREVSGGGGEWHCILVQIETQWVHALRNLSQWPMGRGACLSLWLGWSKLMCWNQNHS